MREIKFRCGFKNRKTGDVVIGIFSFSGLNSHACTPDVWDFLTWELLYRDEFTGLLDKNGNMEIYHNDIVTALWHWRRPHLFNFPHDWFSIIEYQLEDELTIIGNIHENPELLK
jgi:hypothetical protein